MRTSRSGALCRRPDHRSKTHARTRRTTGLVGLLVASALVLAGCGGDGRVSDSGGRGGGAALDGPPVSVMVEAPVDSQVVPLPALPAAAELYEQWINDQGGVAGRPLQVIVCDNRADPAEGAACARKAVAEDVVAVVGSFSADASRSIPILEEAGIAWFGPPAPLVAQEYTSKVSFPIGCLACIHPAAAIKMIEDGCSSIVRVYGDTPVTDTTAPLFEKGYVSAGGDPAKLGDLIRLPLEPGDYSPQAAAVGDADCVLGSIPEANWAALITALQGVGAAPRLYGEQGNLSGEIVEQFPAETEDAVLINLFGDLNSPAFEDFRDALDTYDKPDLDYNALASLGAWTALSAFKEVVEKIDGDITHTSFLDAASKTSSLDMAGKIGVALDFTKEWNGGGGQFPRIFNRTLLLGVVKAGRLTQSDADPIDTSLPFDGKTVS